MNQAAKRQEAESQGANRQEANRQEARKAKIAIIGRTEPLLDDIESQIRGYLENMEYTLIRYEFKDLYTSDPAAIAAAFVVARDSSGMSLIRKMGAWRGDKLPFSIVATSPLYAVEAIRQRALHYILTPLEKADVVEALERMEIRQVEAC
jgi:DNA-binding NtrC family response regulator